MLLSRALFPAIAALEGDEGARKLLASARDGQVIEVEAASAEATLDVDTPEALEEARKTLLLRSGRPQLAKPVADE